MTTPIQLGCIWCDRDDYKWTTELPDDWTDIAPVKVLPQRQDWATHEGICPDCGKTTTMTLEVDELDREAIQRCIAKRQNFGRSQGDKGPPLPDGTGNFAGRYLAEICRGWEEMMEMETGRKL